jgi:lysozyme
MTEIAAHEGIVQMPYRDSVGVWTFGVGHTKWAGSPDPAKMPKGVAQPMGDVAALFAKDIAKYEAGVNKALKGKKVKQHEYDAAVSFHYNTGGIARASWVKYWLQGNKKEAARRMLHWRKPPEIQGRRRKERNLFLYGTYGDGYANVYPASHSGRVKWHMGRRVKVSDYFGGHDLVLDGVYGRRTRAAVRRFQGAHSLTRDGILGPITKGAIDGAMRDRS